MGVSVRELVADPVQAVQANTDLASGAEMMAQLDIGALPVVDDRRLLGVVTDRDLVVRAVAAGVDPTKMTMGEIATTKDLVTIDADADIYRALELMAQNRVRRLIVMDGGGFVGMISLGDLAVQDPSKESVGKVLDEISRSASTTSRATDGSYHPDDDGIPM